MSRTYSLGQFLCRKEDRKWPNQNIINVIDNATDQVIDTAQVDVAPNGISFR